MFLFVFAGAKRKSGKIAKFLFSYVPQTPWEGLIKGVAVFSLQKVRDSGGDSGVFLIYFAVLSLAFELKTSFGSLAIP